MSQTVTILVPDIGNYTDVDVIEVAVKEGDEIQINDTLITLETEKATMDVPADKAGKIISLKIQVGDKVSRGDVIVEIELADASDKSSSQTDRKNNESHVNQEETEKSSSIENNGAQIAEILVPDIGNFTGVDVIEISVSVGDRIKIDDSLITLETEKATMDVPADKAGVITEINVKVGDKVSQGDVILKLEVLDKTSNQEQPESSSNTKSPNVAKSSSTKLINNSSQAKPDTSTYNKNNINLGEDTNEAKQQKAHAGPAVRKLARELGVDLTNVQGSARHQRIVKEDVKNYVKKVLQSNHQSSPSLDNGLDLLAWPEIDFSQFGPIETQPLGRIKKISGKNLSRNWVMIPHVTQHDDADMTELEFFRKQLNQEWQKDEIKVSPLAFIIQACVKALKNFPELNSSLDGEQLILKKYYNIGFAADTPKGLVVPVIKQADEKGLKEISQELKELSQKARTGKLGPKEMQGASFTISSLGGIGGTYFTPIINAPEVAILGVCKSQIKPVWDGNAFQPRLMCPLSLSYDHRVIDGALACRFITYVAKILEDYKRLAL